MDVDLADLRGRRIEVGISPIAWSNDDMHDLGGDIPLETCLREASMAGYRGIELGHKFPRDPSVLTQLLSAHGLRLISGWHSTYFTRNSLDKEIEEFRKHMKFLKAMGCNVVICAECNNTRHSDIDAEPRDGDDMFSEEQWEMLARGLNRAGALASENGMKLVYHHHVGTGVQYPDEIDRLMDMTDPDHVYLLGDTGHIYYGGGDPGRVFKKYRDRIGHVHLKDVRNHVLEVVRKNRISFLRAVRLGVFTVPGDGSIDFRPVFKAIESSDYAGWFVVEAEQDPAVADPLKYARMGREFLRRATGI